MPAFETAPISILLAQVHAMRDRLQNPIGLVKQLGIIVAKESINAFERQGLGNISWPERYPGQRAPKLNIAGALSDFIAGRTSPKPVRFQDRPALVDEGNRGGLLASLTPDRSVEVLDDLRVRVGTNKPYAMLHQTGGESTQTYGEDAKKRMHRWLFKERRRRGPRGGKYMARAGRKDFVPKLAPLLRKNSLTTKVNARPFLGVTDKAEEEMAFTIKRYFERAQRERQRGGGDPGQR